MSASKATHQVRRLVTAEIDRGFDLEAAMKSVARKIGVGFWTIHNIRRGRAKTCDVSIFALVERAYLDLCERQIAALQHEITVTRGATPDVAFDDLEDATAELAARLADARATSLAERVRGGLGDRLARRRPHQDRLTPNSAVPGDGLAPRRPTAG